MINVIKRGDKATLYTDGPAIGAVPCVDYKVQTARGQWWKTKVCQDMQEAERFYDEREVADMATNGYELHGAADL